MSTDNGTTHMQLVEDERPNAPDAMEESDALKLERYDLIGENMQLEMGGVLARSQRRCNRHSKEIRDGYRRHLRSRVASRAPQGPVERWPTRGRSAYGRSIVPIQPMTA
jgi:hypothetical protein